MVQTSNCTKEQMTDLLPRDQRILNTIKEVSWNWSTMAPESSYTIVAATLRALVKEYAFEDLGTEVLISADDVLKLADKLDKVYD